MLSGTAKNQKTSHNTGDRECCSQTLGWCHCHHTQDTRRHRKIPKDSGARALGRRIALAGSWDNQSTGSPGTCELLQPFPPPSVGVHLPQGPWDCPHGPDQLCSLKGLPSYLAWELSSQTLFPWLRGWRPEHKTSFLEGQAWTSASQWGMSELTATFLIHWEAGIFSSFLCFYLFYF